MSRLLPLLPLALAAIVYAPVTRHYFFADDFLHLYRLANLPLVQNIIEPFAGHLYLVRNAVFALLHWLFDVDPRGCFAAMLVTHLANAWLLYGVVVVFTGSRLLACAGAALWGRRRCSLACSAGTRARRCARRHGTPSLPARPRPSRTRWTRAGPGRMRCGSCSSSLRPPARYGDRRGARRSRGRVDRPAATPAAGAQSWFWRRCGSRCLFSTSPITGSGCESTRAERGSGSSSPGRQPLAPAEMLPGSSFMASRRCTSGSLAARRCAGGRLVDSGRRICGEHRRRAGRWLGAVPSRRLALLLTPPPLTARSRPAEGTSSCCRAQPPRRSRPGGLRATTTSARCCWS